MQKHESPKPDQDTPQDLQDPPRTHQDTSKMESGDMKSRSKNELEIASISGYLLGELVGGSAAPQIVRRERRLTLQLDPGGPESGRGRFRGSPGIRDLYHALLTPSRCRRICNKMVTEIENGDFVKMSVSFTRSIHFHRIAVITKLLESN